MIVHYYSAYTYLYSSSNSSECVIRAAFMMHIYMYMYMYVHATHRISSTVDQEIFVLKIFVRKILVALNFRKPEILTARLVCCCCGFCERELANGRERYAVAVKKI